MPYSFTVEDSKNKEIKQKGEVNKGDQRDNIVKENKEKPIKVEEKPFENFMSEDFLPSIKVSLQKENIELSQLIFKKDFRPVIGGECWLVFGQLSEGRKFWICFSSNNLSSSKHIALAEAGVKPSLLESFLIDERKITLPLLKSRLLQRLNGQKWLGKN